MNCIICKLFTKNSNKLCNKCKKLFCNKCYTYKFHNYSLCYYCESKR